MEAISFFKASILRGWCRLIYTWNLSCITERRFQWGTHCPQARTCQCLDNSCSYMGYLHMCLGMLPRMRTFRNQLLSPPPPPQYNSWMPLRDTHQPVGSSGRKSRLPLHSYLIECSQCAETIEMSDICAIMLTPALGKGHFSHNFPFPQNRPPVFYLHCRDWVCSPQLHSCLSIMSY